MKHVSTKVMTLGSCAFRQPFATSHCRYIHGYRLQAKFWFGCSHLDANNWVVDFGGFKDFKKVLENQFDHTTVIASLDPDLELFEGLHKKGIVQLRVMNGVGIEKFAEWCYNEANKFLLKKEGTRVWCAKVEVWEHPENSAIYESNS